MAFKRFVEIGRVVIINYGPLYGKIAVIIDIINTTKVLVHGPTNGVRRQEISIKRLSLTDFKLDIKKAIHVDALKKEMTACKLDDKIKQSPWGKKQERRMKRANNSDFDRFKVKLLRQKRSVLRGKALKAKK